MDKKPYDPSEIEQNLYQKWEESGLFKPDDSLDTYSLNVYVHRPRHSSHSLCPSHVITAVLVVEEDCKLNPSAAAAWRMSSGTGKALCAGRSAWH